MESPLLDRLLVAHNTPFSTFIPLHDHTVYVTLLQECLTRLGESAAGAAVVVGDDATMELISDSGAAIPDRVTTTILSAAIPSGSFVQEPTSVLLPSDRLFVCVSNHITLTLLGSHVGESRFTGGWSLKRVNADALLDCLWAIGSWDAAHASTVAEIPEPTDREMSVLAMDLMAAHARVQAVQHETIAKDKADLFSVLAILKAISAKRRAHDILFVFVEHISKVVRSDRCSIVRIWGGDPHGHVMASHEDASVVDKTIELFKYPELHHSMNTHQKVLVNDARTSLASEPFVQELKQANINSLVVIPIVLFDQHVGSLLLRAARFEGNFTAREVSFFEIVAEAASNALERAQLFESIQVANERLERLAITDGLTGLYNHRHFRDHMQKEFDRASRYRLPLACMIFDVDDFKKLNDTYGHLTGDLVLKEIAERTLKCVRKSDLIARYGGEEFVVIMPQTGREGAEVEGERIRAIIANSPFREVPEDRRVTISAGVSILEHDVMLNAEDLLRAADQALYQAKRNGKNQVVLAPEKGSK